MASSSSQGSMIPSEILESIVGSVPADDKRFIYDRLDVVQEHFIRITDKVRIINPVSNADHSSLPLPNEFQGSDKISSILHCDGLLLCVFDGSKKLAVWNPCFNRVRWVTKPRKSYSFDDVYGIGYDNVSRDNYKILRLYDDVFEDRPTGKFDPPVEIYELKSNSWKTLDIPLDWFALSHCTGVSLKGNMYWVAAKYHDDIFIQCFDFSTETFKEMSLIPFEFCEYDNVVLSSFREDKLSLLHQPIYEEHDQAGEIAVWVTNSVKDGVISWTKLFVVWRPDLPVLNIVERPPYSVYFTDLNNRINVICSEELVTNGSKCVCVSLYTIGQDRFQKKEIERYSVVDRKWPYKLGYVYRPSLVPVP